MTDLLHLIDPDLRIATGRTFGGLDFPSPRKRPRPGRVDLRYTPLATERSAIVAVVAELISWFIVTLRKPEPVRIYQPVGLPSHIRDRPLLAGQKMSVNQ